MSTNSALNRIRVPPDRILVNDKWRGTQLGDELSQKHGGIYSSELKDVADFMPADRLPIIYFSTAEYAAKDYKKRLKKFYDVCRQRGVVIADRNTQTETQYSEVQAFSTFALNMNVLPVVGPQDVPVLLKEVGYIECRSPDNPFKGGVELGDLASIQLSTLTLIPNVGRRKAEELLQHLGHLAAIQEATEQALVPLVGSLAATSIYDFFHKKYVPPS